MFTAMYLVALCGCQSAENQKLAQAEDAVRKISFDPDAAQFRNTRFLKKNLICGEINGKNRLGGYVGFQPFAVAIADNKFLPIAKPERAQDFSDWQSAVLLSRCEPSVVKEFSILFDKLSDEMKSFEL